MIRTKIDPIDRDIEVMLAADLSPQARSKILSDYAKVEFREAQEKNRAALGKVPDHDTFVDGRAGAAVESVKPDGVIVFEWELLDDLFAWIDFQLLTHSPVRSGRYKRSHILLADGIEIDPGADDLPQAEVYTYVNTQPYARKIERGLSSQAPDGVYQVVATLAARRFGNIARIRFAYHSLAGGKSKTDRQPAIVIAI